VDTWIELDEKGRVRERREDRNGDGKPELVATFKDGVLAHVEEDVNAAGCTSLVQDHDAAGNVAFEKRDTNADCKFDLWTWLENGKIVSQAEDKLGKGKATVLTRFDAQQKPQLQEIVSDGKARPDKKLYLRPDGTVRSQCVDGDGNGSLDTRLRLDDAGKIAEVALDTNADGKVDQQESYQGGILIRFDADTNGDGKTDVVEHHKGETITHQDQDSDFDGVLDYRFVGEKSTPIREKVPALGTLGCGAFDDFWKKN
jgi:hypothetical protein